MLEGEDHPKVASWQSSSRRDRPSMGLHAHPEQTSRQQVRTGLACSLGVVGRLIGFRHELMQAATFVR